MEFLTDLIALGAIVSFVLTILAKLLPNDKVYAFGVKIGQALNSFGHARIGDTWEKVEDFFVNSLGQLFSGLKVGLDLEIMPPTDEKKVEENTNVRR